MLARPLSWSGRNFDRTTLRCRRCRDAWLAAGGSDAGASVIPTSSTGSFCAPITGRGAVNPAFIATDWPALASDRAGTKCGAGTRLIPSAVSRGTHAIGTTRGNGCVGILVLVRLSVVLSEDIPFIVPAGVGATDPETGMGVAGVGVIDVAVPHGTAVASAVVAAPGACRGDCREGMEVAGLGLPLFAERTARFDTGGGDNGGGLVDGNGVGRLS